VSLLTVVDVDALWRTTWTAAVAGVGICLVFTFAVLGLTRSSDMRRDDRPAPAVLYGLLAAASMLGTLAGVIYGVALIAT